MARAGIYKSEVLRARDNLIAMGRHPSIDAIRIELGNTGSKGTIHRFLKEIEEEEGGAAGAQVAVSEAIHDLSLRLAERLHEEANQHVSAQADKHKADVAQLNSEITALRSEADAFRSQVERLTLALAAEKSAHEETQTRLQKEKLSGARLSQRIDDMEEQLGKDEAHRQSLEEKHRHAREALEHFREAAKEQREQDHRQFEQQIQFLQGELRTAKDTLNTKQQELIGSHEGNARLSSELAHSRNEVHKLDTEVRSLRATKEQLVVAELKTQQLCEQLAQANEQGDELLKERLERVQRLQESIETGHRLETELAAAKAVLGSQEQILQKLSIVQPSPATKDSAPRKESAENQDSLFGSDT